MSFLDNSNVIATLEFNSQSDNFAGGQEDHWLAIATNLAGRLRNASARPSNYQDFGGGTAEATRKILIFDNPFAVITDVDNRLYRFAVGDSYYEVLQRNNYQFTTQFEVQKVV